MAAVFDTTPDNVLMRLHNFQPNHDPVPRLAGNGIDAGHVTAITIIKVIDHH